MLAALALISALSTAPTPYPACADGSTISIEPPSNALIFDDKSTARFLEKNRDGYAYFTLTVTNGKIDAVIPDSPAIDAAMRETLLEGARTFLFVVNGLPCTPPDTQVLVKFYANGGLQLGPNKHASPAPSATR
jgi:hypothetical protein